MLNMRPRTGPRARANLAKQRQADRGETLSAYILRTVGANWIVARRTPSIVRRYGDDVICLSPARYKLLQNAWEAANRRECCGQIVYPGKQP